MYDIDCMRRSRLNTKPAYVPQENITTCSRGRHVYAQGTPSLFPVPLGTLYINNTGKYDIVKTMHWSSHWSSIDLSFQRRTCFKFKSTRTCKANGLLSRSVKSIAWSTFYWLVAFRPVELIFNTIRVPVTQGKSRDIECLERSVLQHFKVNSMKHLLLTRGFSSCWVNLQHNTGYTGKVSRHRMSWASVLKSHPHLHIIEYRCPRLLFGHCSEVGVIT